MTCESGDVVVVPFPFTDSPQHKVRPALVLSRREFNEQSGHTIMAMITKAKESRWPGDVAIQHQQAGLPEKCVVRLKIFTIDNRLVLRKIGGLDEQDREKVAIVILKPTDPIHL